MKRVIPIALLTILVISLCACVAQPGVPDPQQKAERISVVTTIFPLYDFARAVAGDKIELTILIKPGAEIHSFEPAPADIIKIQNADLLLYIGGESEIWAQRVLDSMGNSGPRALKLMDTVQAMEEELAEGIVAEEHDKDQGVEPAFDEHIWTAPANAVLMVNSIADALVNVDPVHADDYQANAKMYCEQITALDKAFQEVVTKAPRQMLVFGDRFPFCYFAYAYGLEYRAAFPGCSTDTEPAASTLAYLIDIVKNNEIPYIFYIELSNENVARAICEQTGAERLLLHSCQHISRDDFAAGATYVSIMQKNVDNLRKGLN